MKPDRQTASWPEIPGGWTVEPLDMGGWRVSIHRPACPDAFLDDPAVLEANQRDDYMPYWGYLWPSARAMGRWVLNQTADPSRVLELGCGIGLVGLCALRRGHEVTFNDHDPLAVETACRNAEQNGFSLFRPHVCDWRTLAGDRFPIVMANDVLYEVRVHRLLLNLLQRILEPDGVAWLGDPGRQRARQFVELAREAGWTVEPECLIEDAGTVYCLRRR